MVTHTSHSPEETAALGQKWGHEAQPGWLIGLSGDLGAGKTQLVKGLAQGLGIRARVHSPTFSLMNEYSGGRLPLVHLDLYRLEAPAQIVAAGLEEYLLHPTGVTVVEWIERWLREFQISDLKSQIRFRHVRLETVGEKERLIWYEDFGP
jgi:tRNA threonylcarbamoyladenosine biosynthesis protein TsaE